MKPILNTDRRYAIRAASLILLIAVLTITSARPRADTGLCNGSSTTLPFTDVPAANIFFCSIAEAFFAELTNGTTATTHSPSSDVTREQMADIRHPHARSELAPRQPARGDEEILATWQPHY